MTDETRRPGCLDANMLAEYIDGGLEPRQRAEVEAHLAGCEECYETLVETVGASAALVGATVARPIPVWRSWRVLGGIAATLAVALAGWWWMRPEARVNRAVVQIASASADRRLSQGRLSIETSWKAAPDTLRGAADREPSLALRTAVVAIENLTEGHDTVEALHARGIAALASGDLEGALSRLRAAEDRSSGHVSPAIRADLAAAMLQHEQRDGDPTDAVAALEEADRALSENGDYLPALFSRAVAQEILGPRSMAADAWTAYLSHDGTSGWAAEAKRRLAALLQARADISPSAITSFHEIEQSILPAWSEAVLSHRQVDTGQVDRTLTALERVTPDRYVALVLRSALQSSEWPSDRRLALARAVSAEADWRNRYEVGELTQAMDAAHRVQQSMMAAGLPTTGGDALVALVSDRNAVFDSMESLAVRAEREGFLRIAALLRISHGNSGLRRRVWTQALDDFQTAHQLAVSAGDLELASTASAMLADGYRDLGQPVRAWAALQDAMTTLPWVTNKRLVYSVLRAASDAAVEGGYPAASLDYSAQLVSATRDWHHPAARLLAHLDRAGAFDTIGRTDDAESEATLAGALLPEITDGDLRQEYEAELHLTRGVMGVRRAPQDAVAELTLSLGFFESHHSLSRLATVLQARGQAFRTLQKLQLAESDWRRSADLISDDRVQIRDEQLRISRLSSLWATFTSLIGAELDRPAVSLATVERARGRELLDSLSSTQTWPRLDDASLWSWLPERTTGLVYAVLPDELAVWTLRRSGIALRRVPIDEHALGMLVDRALPELLGAGGPAATQLSQYLLDGLAAAQPDDELMLVLDGPLHRVPFAALPIGPGGTERLAERWSTVVAPSLSAARTLMSYRPGAGRTLLVGYSKARLDEGLPSLPGVTREIAALSQADRSALVLVDGGATPAAVLAAAPDSAVIHIAAHGAVNPIYPSQSHLELADGSGPHELAPAAITGLPLTRHPVVVLSSCSTAAGPAVRGEGQLSLGRPFLAAGATAVIAAQWTIDDRATSEFITSVHVALRRGVRAARAVVEAQRSAIHQGVAARVWAAFVVLGGPTGSAAN